MSDRLQDFIKILKEEGIASEQIIDKFATMGHALVLPNKE